MSNPRVCFMGSFDPNYPRNMNLRRGLEELGVEVVLCHMPIEGSTLQRARRMREQFKEIADECDTILLVEFNTNIAWMAWWLAKKYSKKLIIDVVISVYDVTVYDRHQIGPYAPRAIYYWLMDWFALHLPDLVIADTEQHRQYFIEHYNARSDRIEVVPLGAPKDLLDIPVPPPRHDQFIDILYFGSYIPHHGIDIMLEAAKLLEDRNDMSFEFIGRGQIRDQMMAMAQDLGLDNVTFTDFMPFDQVMVRAKAADIILGTFGTTPKAERVITNKVYQAWALGRALVTANTPTLRYYATPGQDVMTVPTGDPGALADAIRTLADDAELRQSLGDSAQRTFEANFTERAIAEHLYKHLV